MYLSIYGNIFVYLCIYLSSPLISVRLSIYLSPLSRTKLAFSFFPLFFFIHNQSLYPVYSYSYSTFSFFLSFSSDDNYIRFLFLPCFLSYDKATISDGNLIFCMRVRLGWLYGRFLQYINPSGLISFRSPMAQETWVQSQV